MSHVFHDHFSGVAPRYADFRPRYPAALFDYLATLAPADAVVWDCACGSGQASVDLAARFGKVIATDASREQIASSRPHPKIEFRVAPADQSGLPDHSIDLVTVAQALHWFPLERFYAEARRVLKPGGILAVWSYANNEVEGEDANAIAEDFYANKVGPYWPPERMLVEQRYRGLPFPFDEIAPPPIRMEERWTLEQLLGYYSTWSATSRCLKETGRNPVEALAAAMAPAWGDPKTSRLVVWPLTLRVGRT